MTGLEDCKDHAAYAGVAIYAEYGSGYIRVGMIEPIAANCGKSDRLVLSAPDVSTCEGAYLMITSFDRKCPKSCDDEDDNKCPDGSAARSPETCGTQQCG